MREHSGYGPAGAAKLQWRLWAALMATGVCLTGISVAVAISERRQTSSLLARPVLTERGQVRTSASERSDFVLRLQPSVPSATVIRELERSCASAGVTISEITISHRPPTADSLGADEFNLRLRGEYAATKGVLIDLLSRFPSATLRSLRLRRDPSTGATETTTLLVVWSRPAADAAVAR